MNRFLLTVTVFCACLSVSFETKAKGKADTLTLTFDEAGKMTSTLPVKIDKTVKIITFKIKGARSDYSGPKETIEKNLKAGYADKQAFLSSQPFANFLGFPQDVTSTSTALTNITAPANAYAPAELNNYYLGLVNVLSITDKDLKAAASINLFPDVKPVSLVVDGKEVAFTRIERDGVKLWYYYDYEITGEANKLSYKITRDNKLEKMAIDWYNKLLKENPELVKSIELFDSYVRENLFREISLLEQYNRVHPMTDGVVSAAIVNADNKIQAFIEQVAANTDFTKNLKEWSKKWLWLNGDKVLLNPFNFTTADKFIALTVKEKAVLNLEQKLMDSLKSVSDLDAFYTYAGREDLYTDRVLAYQAQQTLKEKSAATLTKYIAVDNLLAEGIIPLSTDKQVVNLRNYYNVDADPLSEKLKFKENYPEKENVIITVNNLESQQDVKVDFSEEPFKDSAQFDNFLSEAITVGGTLLSTVNPGVGGVMVLNGLIKGRHSVSSGPGAPGRFGPPPPTGLIERCYGEFDYADKVYEYKIYETSSDISNNSLLVKISDKASGTTVNLYTVLNYTTGSCRSTIDCNCLFNMYVRPLYASLFEYLNSDMHRYLYTLAKNAVNSLPIPSEIKVVNDKQPDYRNKIFRSSAEPSTKYTYVATRITTGKDDTKKEEKIDQSTYKIGRRTRFELTAGLAYTMPAIKMVAVDTSGSNFNVNNDEDRLRLIAGFRVYPFGKGMYVQDSRFGVSFMDRWSFSAAVGIPGPLDNFYLGTGYDLVPGMQVGGGLHLYRYTRYEVLNSQITNQTAILKPRGYISVTMNPFVIVKLLQTL